MCTPSPPPASSAFERNGCRQDTHPAPLLEAQQLATAHQHPRRATSYDVVARERPPPGERCVSELCIAAGSRRTRSPRSPVTVPVSFCDFAAGGSAGVPQSPRHQQTQHYATPGARLRGELPRPSGHVDVQVIMYVPVYARSHMHVRISIRTYTRTDVVRYICVRAHARTCVWVRVCSCVCTYPCTS